MRIDKERQTTTTKNLNSNTVVKILNTPCFYQWKDRWWAKTRFLMVKVFVWDPCVSSTKRKRTR